MLNLLWIYLSEWVMKKNYVCCPYYTTAGKEQGKPGRCGFTWLFKEEMIEDTSITCSSSWRIMRSNFPILLKCRQTLLMNFLDHFIWILREFLFILENISCNFSQESTQFFYFRAFVKRISSNFKENFTQFLTEFHNIFGRISRNFR